MGYFYYLLSESKNLLVQNCSSLAFTTRGDCWQGNGPERAKTGAETLARVPLVFNHGCWLWSYLRINLPICYQCISTLRSQSLRGRELLLSSLPHLFLSGKGDFVIQKLGHTKGDGPSLGWDLTQQQLVPTRIIWPSRNTVVNQRRVMGSSVSFLWQQLGGPEGNNHPTRPRILSHRSS